MRLSLFFVWIGLVLIGVYGEEMRITMPPLEVHYNDAYLCTSTKLPSESMKLTSVEPVADQKVVHHMLLFGCRTPANASEVWPCMGQMCEDQDVVLYGWGRNAEAVRYPSGVAFSIGEGTDIAHLILQIHYVSGRSLDDSSGIVLQLSNEASEKTASVVMYSSNFVVPPRRDRHPIPNKCCYSGFEPIHTVAFRVHTHELGRTVYMKKHTGAVHDSNSVIAQRDPLLPQGFVSVNASTTVFPGEQLEVTCEYDSSQKTEEVRTGATHKDEMCNMYMIVYSEIPHFGQCFNDQGFYFGQKTGIMHPEGQFIEEDKITNLWKAPIHDYLIGQAVSVTRGHDGNLWFLHRADRKMDMFAKEQQLHSKDRSLITSNTVLLLDPRTGKVLSSWGSRIFNVPHMLSVGIDGSIWITDVGLHQVFKFSPEGQLLMKLGEAFVPGSDSSHFCSPTQAVALTDGSVLVSDGYCNQRVIKFDPNGKFVDEVKDERLMLPHSLLADECNDVLFVGDRRSNGVFVYQLSNLKSAQDPLSLNGSQIMALTRGPYNTFLALAWKQARQATIFQFSSNGDQVQVISEWQIHAFEFPHDITLSAAPVEATGAGDRLFALYVAEVDSQQIRKYVLCPPGFDLKKFDHQDEVRDGHQEIKEAMKREYQNTHPVSQESSGFTPKQTEEMSNPQSIQLAPILLTIAVVGVALLYFRRRRKKNHSLVNDRLTR